MRREYGSMKWVAALVIAATAACGPSGARAQEEPAPEPQSWSFAGVFGYFDRGALQRGFQVYNEVCSTCHGLKYVYFRNLGEPGGPGFTEAEVEAIAAEREVTDGPNDAGEMFTRPALPRDTIPSPFANDEEARAANGGALPPDLSVIAQARSIHRGFPWWLIDLFTGYQEQGADYIYAILTGYEEPPAGFEMQPGMHYNRYFPGHQIAMPPPLTEGVVQYADGTPNTIEQMAKDVATFLMWAAEPHLEERKRIGFQVIVFLAVFAGLLYFTKKKIWSKIEH